ncbi:hypothetical protein IIA16_00905 [bacterium]|nr:hypothetical protein [bacterium]
MTAAWTSWLDHPTQQSVALIALWTTLAVVLSWLACLPLRRARGRRAAWQICQLSLLGLLVVELTGLAPAALEALSKPHEVPLVATASSTGVKSGIVARNSGSTTQPPLEGPSRETRDKSPGQFKSKSFDNVEAGILLEFEEPVLARQAREPRSTNSDATGAKTASPLGKAFAPFAAESPTHLEVSIPTADGRSESREGLAFWITVVWWGGGSVVVARLVLGGVLLMRFARRLQPVENEVLLQRVASLARRLGMRRSVRVRRSAAIDCPQAFGVFRPTLVLPASFSEEFNDSQQQAILAHELAHLAGGDPAWRRRPRWTWDERAPRRSAGVDPPARAVAPLPALRHPALARLDPARPGAGRARRGIPPAADPSAVPHQGAGCRARLLSPQHRLGPAPLPPGRRAAGARRGPSPPLGPCGLPAPYARRPHPQRAGAPGAPVARPQERCRPAGHGADPYGNSHVVGVRHRRRLRSWPPLVWNRLRPGRGRVPRPTQLAGAGQAPSALGLGGVGARCAGIGRVRAHRRVWRRPLPAPSPGRVGGDPLALGAGQPCPRAGGVGGLRGAPAFPALERPAPCRRRNGGLRHRMKVA